MAALSGLGVSLAHQVLGLVTERNLFVTGGSGGKTLWLCRVLKAKQKQERKALEERIARENAERAKVERMLEEQRRAQEAIREEERARVAKHRLGGTKRTKSSAGPWRRLCDGKPKCKGILLNSVAASLQQKTVTIMFSHVCIPVV